MQTIKDKVFGKLNWDYFWQKKETININDKNRIIKVIIETDENQKISEVQQNQYLLYQQHKNEYLNKLPKVLLKYYIDNYDYIAEVIDIPTQINKENINESLIMKLIKINDIYFDRSGKYGWLCDCAWDEEHGLCVLLSEDEPRIVEQDFLI